jgi:hypothetical protein
VAVIIPGAGETRQRFWGFENLDVYMKGQAELGLRSLRAPSGAACTFEDNSRSMLKQVRDWNQLPMPGLGSCC